MHSRGRAPQIDALLRHSGTTGDPANTYNQGNSTEPLNENPCPDYKLLAASATAAGVYTGPIRPAARPSIPISHRRHRSGTAEKSKATRSRPAAPVTALKEAMKKAPVQHVCHRMRYGLR